MQIYNNSAAICGPLAGLPSPDIPTLEAGCKRLMQQWQEEGKLALTGGAWFRQSQYQYKRG